MCATKPTDALGERDGLGHHTRPLSRRGVPEWAVPTEVLARWATIGLTLLLVALGTSGCAEGPETSKPGPGREAAATRPSRVAQVDLESLRDSVHAKLDCSDCHAPATGAQRHSAGTEGQLPSRCDGCHEEEARAYDDSVHGKLASEGNTGAARCGHCHGSHDIHAVDDPRSWVNKRRLPSTCGKCHENRELAIKLGIRAPDAGGHYLESIHGKGLVKDGLLFAPSCVDCHGSSHNIQQAADPRSTVHHERVPQTCGKCHTGIAEVYELSVHGQRLAAGESRAAVCTDCHTAHQIWHPESKDFKLESDARCGQCHADRLAGYLETYHGEAQSLGREGVAACYDCHGHHDIRSVEDPDSRLAPANRLKTCQQCHPTATTNLTGYLAHADHTDRENYPRLYWTFVTMTALLVGVFGFFGLHTLLWLIRSLVAYRRDPAAFREAKREARQEREGKLFWRFRPVDRFCHFLVIFSFLLLVFTGMPLKFSSSDWAQTVFHWVGGVSVAASLHRLGALITFFYFGLHVASLVALLWRHRGACRDDQGQFRFRKLLALVFGPDSPAPRLQDLRDFWAHLKWFVGRGPKPQFDRFTYWEKFDYLAVFWGVAIIGLSGLMLWFPEAATRILPGWAINVAQVVHSDEALLAAGFIFLFHFFNVHLRPERFPMDLVIFSGRMTEHEMLAERRRLHERLQANGTLDDARAPTGWHRWKPIFAPIGMTAFLIGMVLAIAIMWTMSTRMLGW
ncbi:MAG: hypothetical protein JRI68_16240 [Deltaproteobacteria bacterium]|nr:hypothetical protein [Deltaproteobacteria bacterium]